MSELNESGGTGDLTGQAALVRIETLQRATIRGSGWLVRFQLAFGATGLVVVLILGLLPGTTGVIVSVVFNACAVTALSVYAVRQRVAHRGMARSHFTMMAGWAALYCLVLIVGVNMFPGNLRWWIPGAVLVSLPGFLSAAVTHRRLKQPVMAS